MSNSIAELAWKMICELRIEVREAQKIRTQVIGIKIAFVTASFGFVFGAEDDPNYSLLLIPAFASVFFDYLIVSYGFSIKRIGYYCRSYLEPKLRAGVNWPSHEPLWEEAMSTPTMRQHFANAGNIGLTVLAVAAAVAFIMNESWSVVPVSFVVVLTALFVADVYFSYWYKYAPQGLIPWPNTTSQLPRSHREAT